MKRISPRWVPVILLSVVVVGCRAPLIGQSQHENDPISTSTISAGATLTSDFHVSPSANTGSTSAAATSAASPLVAELGARPLTLPTIISGSACPVNAYSQPIPGVIGGIGDGPVYVALEGSEYNGVVMFPKDWDFAVKGDTYLKTQWFAGPDTPGPVLVRGRQLNGSYEITFVERNGSVAADSLAPSAASDWPGAPGWHNWFTLTNVGALGCYAFQVDGAEFSEVIVFEIAIP